MGVGTRHSAGRQAEGLERERGRNEGRKGTEQQWREKRQEGGRVVGRSVDSRPQSGSVYKVKEETNGAAVVTLLKWGLA